MARVMGVDYGRKRIGLAVSDEDEVFAFPREVLELQHPEHAVRRVAEAARALDVARIVVGLPLNMDGSQGPMAEEVTRFIQGVAKSTGLGVETWDERLTSYSAEQMLIEADVRRQKRKGLVDKIAAQQILQSYLDARAGAKGAAS